MSENELDRLRAASGDNMNSDDREQIEAAMGFLGEEEIRELRAQLEVVKAERDEARAQLEAMRKGEPMAWMRKDGGHLTHFKHKGYLSLYLAPTLSAVQREAIKLAIAGLNPAFERLPEVDCETIAVLEAMLEAAPDLLTQESSP